MGQSNAKQAMEAAKRGDGDELELILRRMQGDDCAVEVCEGLFCACVCACRVVAPPCWRWLHGS